MPTYRFRRKNGKEFEKVMMIAEMEEYRKNNPKLELCIPTTLNIVSSVGTLDGKTDGGWKDMLSRIGDAHPTSNLSDRYSTKTNAQVKTKELLTKSRRKKK
jgi:hypothetical protein